jgi:hypothetical protein
MTTFLITLVLQKDNIKLKIIFIDIIEKKRLQWYGHVKRMPQERIPKLIMEWIPWERRNRGRPRKTWLEGVTTSSHDNKEFITRSMEKQRGMAFGFRKMATAVKKTGWIDKNYILTQLSLTFRPSQNLVFHCMERTEMNRDEVFSNKVLK